MGLIDQFLIEINEEIVDLNGELAGNRDKREEAKV